MEICTMNRVGLLPGSESQGNYTTRGFLCVLLLGMFVETYDSMDGSRRTRNKVSLQESRVDGI